MDNHRRVGRRRFLEAAGGVLGAGALVVTGVGVWATRDPELDFAMATCGKESQVGDKILVAYASKCGSTGEVADAIGKVLCEGGASVDVRRVQDVNDLSPYRALILGTAMRMEKPVSEAVSFAKGNRAALGQMQVACFSLGIGMREDTPENREKTKAMQSPLLNELHNPASVGTFGGKVDYSKLSPLWRLMGSLDKSGLMREGDWRNWDTIQAWAVELAPKLVSA